MLTIRFFAPRDISGPCVSQQYLGMGLKVTGFLAQSLTAVPGLANVVAQQACRAISRVVSWPDSMALCIKVAWRCGSCDAACGANGVTHAANV